MAKYASMYRESDKKRQVAISQPPDYRSDFRRDYARLVHSPAFRRLQGKTQLFPGQESDFFRNRLTHSLEVAQIAKSITLKINNDLNANLKIDCDLVEFSALAHDLGHPPFGHLGEEALDERMMESGGFEGNAQTLRILAKLEKRHLPEDTTLGITKHGKDLRTGLNLTHRSLSSILKYDRVIPIDKRGRDRLLKERKIPKISPVKGFYLEEEDIVKSIKESVGNDNSSSFKTVECQIMDIADDIAYSCYDLEDSFKAGFLTPLQLITLPKEIIDFVTEKVNLSTDNSLDSRQIQGILQELFGELFDVVENKTGSNLNDEFMKEVYPTALQVTQKTSSDLATCGYQRTSFTSKLVGAFIESVTSSLNKELPALSKVDIKKEARLQVEVLKHVTFASQILSPKLKIVERRGKEIVSFLFDTLTDNNGEDLLPEDHRQIVKLLNDNQTKKRAVCDFISGMTDRYALEFYSRLKSENPQTIFKPF